MSKFETPLPAMIFVVVVVLAWKFSTLVPIFAGIVGVYLFVRIVRN